MDWMKTGEKSKKPRMIPRFGAQTAGQMAKARVRETNPGQCHDEEISNGWLPVMHLEDGGEVRLDNKLYKKILDYITSPSQKV